MATVSDVTTFPADVGPILAEADRIGEFEKKGEKSGTDEERSEKEGSVVDTNAVVDSGESRRTSADGQLRSNGFMVHFCPAETPSVSRVALISHHILGQYTEEQYKQLKKKIDRYLLPLMWLCYGIQ